jgi:hypothetical protein
LAALIDVIDVKRKTLFEHEKTPFYCLEAEVNTPTARGGQTLVRLKMRNLLTSAVFEKTVSTENREFAGRASGSRIAEFYPDPIIADLDQQKPPRIASMLHAILHKSLPQ